MMHVRLLILLYICCTKSLILDVNAAVGSVTGASRFLLLINLIAENKQMVRFGIFPLKCYKPFRFLK